MRPSHQRHDKVHSAHMRRMLRSGRDAFPELSCANPGRSLPKRWFIRSMERLAGRNRIARFVGAVSLTARFLGRPCPAFATAKSCRHSCASGRSNWGIQVQASNAWRPRALAIHARLQGSGPKAEVSRPVLRRTRPGPLTQGLPLPGRDRPRRCSRVDRCGHGFWL